MELDLDDIFEVKDGWMEFENSDFKGTVWYASMSVLDKNSGQVLNIYFGERR